MGCSKTQHTLVKDAIGNDVLVKEYPPQCGSAHFKISDKPPQPYLDYLQSFKTWNKEAFPPVPYGMIKFESKDSLIEWLKTTQKPLSVWAGKTKISLPISDKSEGGQVKTADYWIYVIWQSKKTKDKLPQLGELWQDSEPVMYALVHRPYNPELFKKAMEYHSKKRKK